MKGMSFVAVLMLVLAACGGGGTPTDGDSDGAVTSSTDAEQGPPDTEPDICESVAIDSQTFGAAIGREGLEERERGAADPDFFNVDGVVSCSIRYLDPIQANRNDGFSVWAMPASGASADQLAEGVVSLNPSGLDTEPLDDPPGFVAVVSGGLYLGVAGSDGVTSAYAQINPRMESLDTLISIVQSALDG